MASAVAAAQAATSRACRALTWSFSAFHALVVTKAGEMRGVS